MTSSPTSPEASARNDIDRDESGVEVELDDQEKITHPFDPKQIKIRTVNVVAEQIVSRIRDEVIDLAPDFQRLRGIWDTKRKSRLIESLLLRIPIPVFYVAADEDENWVVVDGVQRMSTIYDYVDGRFSLRQLEYLTWLDGHTHDKLPRPLQRRISETQIIVNVIEPGTPVEVMFNIFLRLNTGGLTLNGQEIRHAITPGPVRAYLKELAEFSEFKEATQYSIAIHRMADRECVLRFLSFHIVQPERYAAKDLDTHLGNAMRNINEIGPEKRAEIAAEFKKAMCAATAIFGENAFRKPPTSQGRYPISKVLFETWSVQLARCSPGADCHPRRTVRGCATALQSACRRGP